MEDRTVARLELAATFLWAILSVLVLVGLFYVAFVYKGLRL